MTVIGAVIGGGKAGLGSVSKLSTGNKIAILGDSYDTSSIETLTTAPTGIWQQTNMLMGQRLDFVNIDAVTGSGAIATPTYASRIQTGVFDHSVGYCALRVSINDNDGTNTLQEIIDAYTSLFTDINANGLTIIANLLPGVDEFSTPNQVSICISLNQWLLNSAPALFDIIVIDMHHQMLDKDALDMSTNPALTSVDGNHPNIVSAFDISQTAAKQLLPHFPNKSPLSIVTAIGVDDASIIDPNPTNTGTSGTLYVNVPNGISNTGTVCDGFLGQALNGSAVWSIVERTDGGAGKWQQAVWSPVAAHQICQFAIPFASRNQPLNSGVQIGDIVSAMFEVEFDTNNDPNDIWYGGIVMEFVGSGVIVQGNTFNSDNPALGFTGWKGVIKSPRNAIPAGTTHLKIEYKVFNKTTNPITFRFGQHGLINYSR